MECAERLDGLSRFSYKLPGRSSKDCAVCSDRRTRGSRRETAKPAATTLAYTEENASSSFTHCSNVGKAAASRMREKK